MTDDPIDQQLAAIALGETWLRDRHEAITLLNTLDHAEVPAAVGVLSGLGTAAYMESYRNEAARRSAAVLAIDQAVAGLMVQYDQDANAAIAALGGYRDELLGRQTGES
jgi:hypothetical protein